MGWFNKEEEKKGALPELPKLPELPRLPGSESRLPSTPETGPTIPEEPNQEEVHQLPTFPTSAAGDKFSQDTIKNAVVDESEAPEVATEEPEIAPIVPEMPTMKEPEEDYKVNTEPMETSPEMEKRIIPRDETSKPKIDEPIFIRIDKFEESLNLFNKIKEKVSEVGSLLEETKEIKNKETIELTDWEAQIQKIKDQIEKIDEDIFSKVA